MLFIHSAFLIFITAAAALPAIYIEEDGGKLVKSGLVGDEGVEVRDVVSALSKRRDTL